jgi:hypothetical protein
MKQKNLTLQKIWLPSFIDILIEMYDRGANYVDIIGYPDGKQDTIQIIVKEEYLCPDDVIKEEKMTREKLNDLLNG